MLAGHYAVALTVKRCDPRRSLAGLFFAVMALDWLLWLLVLAGLESAHGQEQFPHTHFLTFTFPWSHSLLAAIAWTLLAAGLAALWSRGAAEAKTAAAKWYGLAVFSHFLLDWLVHNDIALGNEPDPTHGLRLWETYPLALTVEIGLTLAALGLYLYGLRPAKTRAVLTVLFVLGLCAMTAGPLFMAEAPPPAQMAGSSLCALAIFTLCAYFLDPGPRPAAHGPTNPRPPASEPPAPTTP